MPIFSVTDAGAVGIIRDVPGYELPPNAWTFAENVRMQDGSVHKANGHEAFTSPPEQDPYFVYPVQAPTSYYWIYLGLQKAFATRGIYHYDITRAAGNYTGTTSDRWTGTNLGGTRVFNNGVDLPQYWMFPTSHTNALQDLGNWPSTYRCKTMRAYKNYLIATNVTKASTVYPNLVKWSHGADIGHIPASWDETDPTLDAGEYPLPYGGGVIDQMGMRDIHILYCDDTVWAMQYVGGPAIFRFWPIFESLGLLAPNCVAEFYGSHFVVTPDDVGIHDGQTFKSVADKRIRHNLFGGAFAGFAMGNDYFDTAFVLHNRPEKEMWICYPVLDNALSTLALVWSYGDDTWGIRDLPGLVSGAVGIIDPLVGPNGLGTWNGWTQGSWASATSSWAVSSTANTNRGFDGRAIGLVAAAPDSGALGLIQLDSNTLYGTDVMTSYVDRRGLVLSDPSRRDRYKVTAIYPHITGTAGGVVQVWVGTQDVYSDSFTDVNWIVARSFTIGTDYKVDVKNVDTRFVAIKFYSDTDIEWHLKGYDIDYEISGTK